MFFPLKKCFFDFWMFLNFLIPPAHFFSKKYRFFDFLKFLNFRMFELNLSPKFFLLATNFRFSSRKFKQKNSTRKTPEGRSATFRNQGLGFFFFFFSFSVLGCSKIWFLGRLNYCTISCNISLEMRGRVTAWDVFSWAIHGVRVISEDHSRSQVHMSKLSNGR